VADGREATCFSGIPEEPGCPVLYFAPHQRGWVAAWRHIPRTTITIDLSRPVTRSGDVWSFVDLELDLWHVPDSDLPVGTDPRPRLRRHGRTVGFAYDDELDDAVNHGWITPAEADRTRAEARRVAGLVLDALHPFTEAAWERFEAAATRGLPAPQQRPGAPVP
jgi:predicted RNA-binding protein associated with RNAse of E/G family